jgi:hypothetical protein
MLRAITHTPFLTTASALTRLSSITNHLPRTTKMPLLTTSSGKPRAILGLMTFGPPGCESKGARVTSIDTYNQCLDYLQEHGYR